MDLKIWTTESLIRARNDRLLKNAHTTNRHGTIIFTRAVHRLGDAFKQSALEFISIYKAFSREVDPFGVHEGGAFTLNKHRVGFRIDYFDHDLTTHSPAPDQNMYTTRVLTIYLIEDAIIDDNPDVEYYLRCIEADMRDTKNQK